MIQRQEVEDRPKKHLTNQNKKKSMSQTSLIQKTKKYIFQKKKTKNRPFSQKRRPKLTFFDEHSFLPYYYPCMDLQSFVAFRVTTIFESSICRGSRGIFTLTEYPTYLNRKSGKKQCKKYCVENLKIEDFL